MVYRILRTEEFIKQFNKLPKNIRKKIKKLRNKIKENPFVGDPLGHKFFREKKIEGLRLYFLVYEELILVLLVAISNKKEQQVTINSIKINFIEYYQDVHKKMKEN